MVLCGAALGVLPPGPSSAAAQASARWGCTHLSATCAFMVQALIVFTRSCSCGTPAAAAMTRAHASGAKSCCDWSGGK
jgi:hypothetical protein